MSNEKPVFSGRTLVVAFEGWTDAAEAASLAGKLIRDQLQGEEIELIDPEDYFDFQYIRPSVEFDEDGDRVVNWPTVSVTTPNDELVEEGAPLGRIHVLNGSEPSHRWRTFTAEIVEQVVDLEIEAVLFLGASLADTPHTRPIRVVPSSLNNEAIEQLNIRRSQYEGPVGVANVLVQALEAAGIPCVMLWAEVPHYVHSGPSPKAALALLNAAEHLIGIQVDHEDLATEAFAWERGIDELAESDEEMAAYIQSLEAKYDAGAGEATNTLQANVHEGTGDELAAEFEEFLREIEQKPKDGDEPVAGE
jgi:hypothetical protein